MEEITTNLNPLMTGHLVTSGVFEDDPIIIIDVGARWGFNAEWNVFGGVLQVYCFEPDEEECARLNVLSGPNVKYIAAALGKAPAEMTLYETRITASTGLYKTNMGFFSRLLNRDNADVLKERRIHVTTLEEALSRFNVKKIDFIKLDVEGSELDILLGAGHFMLDSNLIGILSEIRFQEEINGSPVFWELDSYVRKKGFRLFNMCFTHQSRHALPYPSLADTRLPDGEKFYSYTKHGQIMDGDALYFRDLLIDANKGVAASSSNTQILKAAALFEIYCLNDCAAELILTYRARLSELVDCDHLLDLLAAPMRKKEMDYKSYIYAYFRPDSAVVVEQDPIKIIKALAKAILPFWVKDMLRKIIN